MPDTPMTSTLSLTDSAVKRLAVLREKEGNPNLLLRVTVLGGGCSGFQYELGLDDKINDDDVKFDGIVTDTTSIQFLSGAEVDYMQSIVKSAFKIRNPNEAAGCGCGKSFAPKM
ncbi:MAG: iron-sulfur cluster assembly accessory protein [bacterium]|nr:iron-sulfur cluster assembly accessory protein [bacterium]